MFKKYVLGIGLSAGALALLIYVVDWPAALHALQTLHYGYLLLCFVLMLLPFLFRWLRWRLLLKPLGNLPGLPVLSAMAIGFLANNILPAHLGEFIRAWLLGRSQGVSKSAVLATVVMERIFDGLALLLMLLTVLLLLEPSQAQTDGLSLAIIKTAGWLGAAIFVGLLIFMQLLRFHRHKLLLLMRRLSGFLSPARQEALLSLLENFALGLAITNWRHLLGISVYSLLVWLCFGLAAYALFPAFNLHLGLLAAILLQCIIALSMLIPSAPAYVGTFQLATVFTLTYLGADTGVAGSYSLILWLVSILVSTVFGLVMLSKEGLSLKEVAKAGQND